MKILIIPNLTKSHCLEHTSLVIGALKEIGCNPVIDDNYYNAIGHLVNADFYPLDEIAPQCEFFITIGGDGTVLNAAQTALYYDKAILGINSGTLGYLTHLEPTDLYHLKRIITGDYQIDERIVLEGKLEDGRVLYALNDIVISRGVLNKVININMLCDGRPMLNYRADGVIISTPTGSTAYSLSAGGALIDPTIDSIITTPICPHSLANRSIILSSKRVLTVSAEISAKNPQIYVAADGDEAIPIERNSPVEIKISNKTIKFIRLDNNDFYDIVNTKLRAY